MVTFPLSESFTINTRYNLAEIIFIFITSLLFDGGGLMEELGWRGFALPRLQKKFSPLFASIILGTIWALWHIPIKTDVFSSLFIDPILIGTLVLFVIGIFYSFYIYRCPSCKRLIGKRFNPQYCENCGVALK